jgi:RND superfamily putative drug exporter
LFPKLPLAAGISAGAFLVVLLLAFRSLRIVPVAIVTLLPAAAACGLCVLVFQDGHLAEAIDQQRQGALETGAVASLLAALVSVSAARGVGAIQAVRAERALGLERGRAAEMACASTLPAALVATLIAAVAVAVLAGSDLYSAREFGLAVAVGLLVDLILLRVPLVAALARWAG